MLRALEVRIDFYIDSTVPYWLKFTLAEHP